MAAVAEEQAVAPAPHATQVVPEVTKPIVEHPVAQAAVELKHLVHTPETTTYPVEHDEAYGALHTLVPGKQATQDPEDTV